jgi:hypothetical protein
MSSRTNASFSLQLWSFQVFAIPKISKSAADSIAQSDFVVFSLHGAAGLPARMRRWIDLGLELICAYVNRLERIRLTTFNAFRECGQNC